MPKKNLPSVFVENDILGTDEGFKELLKSTRKQQSSIKSSSNDSEPLFYIDYSKINIPNDFLLFYSNNQARKFMNQFK